MLDPEAMAYLDGEWTATQIPSGAVAITGHDEGPIALCNYNNVGHALTPFDVAAYLLELKRDRKRLEWWFSWDARQLDIHEYLSGVEQHWNIDQWRGWIDEQMAREAQPK